MARLQGGDLQVPPLPCSQAGREWGLLAMGGTLACQHSLGEEPCCCCCLRQMLRDLGLVEAFRYSLPLAEGGATSALNASFHLPPACPTHTSMVTSHCHYCTCMLKAGVSAGLRPFPLLTCSRMLEGHGPVRKQAESHFLPFSLSVATRPDPQDEK